jgi:hypothetical protein
MVVGSLWDNASQTLAYSQDLPIITQLQHSAAIPVRQHNAVAGWPCAQETQSCLISKRLTMSSQRLYSVNTNWSA